MARTDYDIECPTCHGEMPKADAPLCKACAGTGLRDFPWTGLTLTLDGDPRAVAAVWDAARKEMERQVIERGESAEFRFTDGLHFRGLYYDKRWPFTGSIGFRNDRFDLERMPLA